MVSYRDLSVGALHLSLVCGKIDPKSDTLVRVHEPLSVLDLLDVRSGTHSWSVGEALKAIQKAGAGVMVLMNCSEAGNALESWLENPHDAKASRPRAGRSMDLRLYGIGAQILRDLGVGRMRLMAAPRKMPSMAGFGLEVSGYLRSSSELPKG
jgi:3,4-dihydroxy 2-butanone 4-phosphate synthase/GTP cyclohydrolase II